MKFFRMLLKKLRCQLGFAALTATKVIDTEFGGDWKILIKTVTLESASDTLTLVRATDKVTEIGAVIPVLQGGQDAALLGGITASFSGLVITLASQAEGGTASTNWDNAVVRLIIIAR